MLEELQLHDANFTPAVFKILMTSIRNHTPYLKVFSIATNNIGGAQSVKTLHSSLLTANGTSCAEGEDLIYDLVSAFQNSYN